MTLRSVAVNRGIPVTGRVHVEGDLDFAGIIGADRDAPAGFTAIRLRFELETDASQDQLDSLTATTERYCTVYRTLLQPPPVTISFGAAAPTG